MLALRCAIGWHFFSEGLAHKNDPKWSSEGFLRAAKGPLAGMYKSHLPTDHDFEHLVLFPIAPEKPADDTIAAGGEPVSEEAPAAKSGKPATGADSPVSGKWYNAIVSDWENGRRNIANFYRYNDEQIASSNALLDDYEKKLTGLLAGYSDDITQFRHNLARNRKMATEAGADNIPNLKTRLTKRDAAPIGLKERKNLVP
jgi:hypothetical protein